MITCQFSNINFSSQKMSLVFTGIAVELPRFWPWPLRLSTSLSVFSAPIIMEVCIPHTMPGNSRAQVLSPLGITPIAPATIGLL